MSAPEPTPADRELPAPPPPPPASDDGVDNERPALGDTVGTGTSIALGCLAATLLLIVIGLVFLAVVMIIG